MFANSLRRQVLYVYLLHMGGPDGDALEWQALASSRFLARLRKLGVAQVSSAEEADVVIVTGVLTERNRDAVIEELARMPATSSLVVAGDAAIDGGVWADMPGLSEYPLSHYIDVQITVPGSPPTPQALLAALGAAVNAE